MTYRAYLDDPMFPQIGKVPIFPRSQKTSVFKTINAASRRLQTITRYKSHDTRGLVYDATGNLVYTLAL